MSKSQEQRIADAAESLDREGSLISRDNLREVAARMLEAADREVTWPSLELVAKLADEFALRGRSLEIQCILRGALLEDPIIKAAIALRSAFRGEVFNLKDEVQAVVTAVEKAGL